MPVYCYRSKDGRVRDEYYPVAGSAPARIRRDGVVWVRDISAEWNGRPKAADVFVDGYSMAMGCIPQQYEEKRRFMARQGIEYKTDPEGRAIVRDKKHREAMRKALGLIDYG